jgi:hypothetical protein
MKITFDGSLPVSEGDEIEIQWGLDDRGSGRIRATRIRNRTKGADAFTMTEAITTYEEPKPYDPPIVGYAKNVVTDRSQVTFVLEEKSSPLLADAIRGLEKFIDRTLYERLRFKDHRGVLTDALALLEERMRERSGADPNASGTDLVDYALDVETGKLIPGETEDEREALYLLFRGATELMREHAAHHLPGEPANVETLEVICLVDFLLRKIDGARPRS